MVTTMTDATGTAQLSRIFNTPTCTRNSDSRSTSTRKEWWWHWRLLLMIALMVVSFESVSVSWYGIWRGAAVAPYPDDRTLLLQTTTTTTTPPAVIENSATMARQQFALSEEQHRELLLFRQQYPSLWNHTVSSSNNNDNNSNLLLEPSSPYYRYNYYVHFGMYQYQFYDAPSFIHPTEKSSARNKLALFLLHREEPSLIGDDSLRISDLFDQAHNKTTLPPQQQQQQRDLKVSPERPTRADATDTWVLAHPLKHATRNHDTIILESATRKKKHTDSNNNSTTAEPSSAGGIVAVTLLGRHSRFVQSMDLITGRQRSVRTANVTDPDGMPLDDLNHVSAVLVDSIPTNDDDDDGGSNNSNNKQEIWLPCGFHNDKVNSEVSTRYARIVDVDTMRLRTGPKLPMAGGACVSTAVTVIAAEPPMICTFGGTQGTHDRGQFLRETACFDRRRDTWWSPFGTLPYGLDHGSLAAIPAGVCHAADPGRILILNFRTKPYGAAHPEMLAFDMPSGEVGWKLQELQQQNVDRSRGDGETKWYLYYNDTRSEWEDTKDVGRDASGTIVVNGGRQIVNFGGTYHYFLENGKRKRGRFSMIRSFDVCEKQWSVIGDLGLHTFALQTAASQDLQLAVTCGGEAPMRNSNGHWCFVNRFHNNMRLSNRYERTPV